MRPGYLTMTIKSLTNLLFGRIKLYWSLIKSLQTGLLLLTGLVGFVCAGQSLTDWPPLMGLAGSLFLAISGSTVLNMWVDRDIDALMQRTCWRPLPAGYMHPTEAFWLGALLAIAGVAWAAAIDPLYGLVVFAGLFFDVVIYTMWLKRRTPWSIVWGGLAGGMPVLAGRALGLGYIDWIGVLLALAILFWIPTHILTFAMRYDTDYRAAGVPTVPSVYGFQRTRLVIALSSLLAAAAIGIAAWGVGMTAGLLYLVLVLSVGLLFLAATSVWRKSDRLNFGLFKYASLYMLGVMVLMLVETGT